MKYNYKPWVLFLIFLIILLAVEMFFGCAISLSKTPNASGLMCKDTNYLSYIVDLIFQLFIIFIVSAGIIIAHRKNSEKK